LIASVSAGHIVEFSAGGAGVTEASALLRIEGVKDVRTEHGRAQLQVADLHHSVPAILSELTRQGVSLTDLRTRTATLEDVFVALTGRRLRDE